MQSNIVAQVKTSERSTRRLVLILEAGEVAANCILKFKTLDAEPEYEPHVAYWGRNAECEGGSIASELPSERVHRFGRVPRSQAGTLVERLRGCIRAAKLIRDLQPWCVHATSLDLYAVARLAFAPAGGTVFELLDSRPWMHSWWARPLIRRLLRRSPFVVVASARFESHFLRRHGLISPGHPVLCVPNPVSPSRFAGYSRRPWTEGDIVIGYIGTFRGVAAIRALTDAIAAARKRGIAARGLFAGGMGPDLPLVKQLCSTHDYLSYSGPFDQSCELAKLYGQVNLVYAVYDDSEDKKIHHAVRLGEAILARLPIVVMTGTYMAEIVAGHGVGFEVPLGDSDAIEGVIAKLWRDRNLFSEIAERCGLAEPFFTSDHYAPKLLEAYRMLGQGATPVHSRNPAERQTICANCVMDLSDKKITFDEDGVCDHCRDFMKTVRPRWHTDERGAKELQSLSARIRDAGQNKPYDSIMGLSGGADSSYLLHIAVTQMRLRPLVFHVDGGWNSQIAVHNIEVMIRKLGLHLYTEVINWEEMKEFQLCYLKSGLANLDVPQDHAFVAVLYNFALKHRIRYILNGGNVSTESVRNPLDWMYYGTDMAQIKDLLRRYARFPMRSYPFSSVLRHKIYLRYLRGVEVVKPLNYVPYIKADAMKFLEEEYGWQPYPQKHFESRFTRFYEGYWLPRRFGYDTRRVQFSSLILTGQMTRDEALRRLERPAMDDDEGRREFEYVAAKLGISVEELQGYFTAPKRSHRDYRNTEWMFVRGAKAMRQLGLERSIKR